MTPVQVQLLKTLCFFDVLGYPPTWIEWLSAYEHDLAQPLPTWQDLEVGARELVEHKQVHEARGRIVFPEKEALIPEHELRTRFMPRKLRRARRVASLLSRIEGVRFVALCNTTAMSHAKDESDLDFFVVSREGSLWQTRGWATLPFKLLGLRPKPEEERDAVCLSFFLDESRLDLSPLMLSEDDPYFRFWFLELLPLIDDGIGQELWRANQGITSRHPFAEPWMVHPQLGVKPKKLIKILTPERLESAAKWVQYRAFSPLIKRRMNQSTDVVVDDHYLKLHVEDGRFKYKQAYETACLALDLRT